MLQGSSIKISLVLLLATGLACSDSAPSNRIDGSVANDAAGQSPDLGENAGTLKGTVQDPRGIPIGDALLAAAGQTTTADFTGAYTLPVPAGALTVTATAPWFAETQQDATVGENAETTLDITLDDAELKIEAADKTLADTYNTSFDWSSDTVSVSVVSEPTKRAFESAVYWLNPVFYDPDGDDVTPSPAPTVLDDDKGGENFDFVVGRDTADEKDVLVAASIRDQASDTPVDQAAQDAFLMWEPMLQHLRDWEVTKASDLVLAGLGVTGQLWRGSSNEPQTIEKVFIYQDKLWAQIAFKPFVKLDNSITDSDGDGRVEIFAQLNPALYASDLITELKDNYVAPQLGTDGLREVVDALVNTLYDKTNPEVVATPGQSYEAAGVGTFSYPFVALRHAQGGVVNVFLVAPGN